MAIPKTKQPITEEAETSTQALPTSPAITEQRFAEIVDEALSPENSIFKRRQFELKENRKSNP